MTDVLNPHCVADHSRRSTDTGSNEARIPTSHTLVRHKSLETSLAESSEYFVDLDSENISSDIWSMAYREAVKSFDRSDLPLLEGKNVSQLFKSLEEIESDSTRDSAFTKGLNRLRKLKPALETFQLVLDLATPLASIEPVATTVVGLTKSVTAVSFFQVNPLVISSPIMTDLKIGRSRLALLVLISS